MSDSLLGRIGGALEERDLLLVLLTLGLVYVLFALSVLDQGLGSIVSTLARVTFLSLSFALVALALNLHWGYTGLFNIGVVAFMMVGVYTMAMLTRPPDPAFGAPGLGLPLWVGILAGVAVAAILGLLTALPALRLRADYLAIVTLGLSEIVRLTIASGDFNEWLIENVGAGTGSATSLTFTVSPQTPIRGLYFTDAGDPTALGTAVFGVTDDLGISQSAVVDWTYILALAVVLIAVYLFLERLGRSPFGRILKAIREDEVVASSLGKDIRMAKIKVFVIGCALMGLGGILWYGAEGAANPQAMTYSPLYTFYIFIAVIVGGAGSNTGSVLGGIVFASFLFEGPRRAGGFVRDRIAADVDTPENFAEAVAPFSSLDFTPFIAYATDEIAALQFVLLGLVLIFIMHRRPDGLLGHRVETASAVDLSERPETGGDDNE
ncbi:ABC-type transport system permease protein (probable substrate branched-chain amino acids) [Natronomonas pharaonis DSM 2160]|uniref:ABC-type transport system permease protein (Probable substrate branched-chain amino acids) n=1 Tax=Natronomonas pharaonis (strain ATCC 35678 / DSM 2160 / CIP 103997 / JCM 8858 / NBRC 14720 / NCIMB 2260 / Gabara) TaxID=348780 RepID=A0A1U7EY54_NATPD|nr:branched-chain amino acid ABC transporter permease [Natronomonas pharaonis]CAI50158.1 ABC-type transport system permease protein (probable substrate branched-chain amino acids) [Natronomonas pharaonis DSM 2160]